MNQLHYLQELSYIYQNPYISGVAKAKSAFSIHNIAEGILDSEDIVSMSGEVPATDMRRYANDIAISTIENYSSFFLEKRESASVAEEGFAEFNRVYLDSKKQLDNNYSILEHDPTDCCNQSGIYNCDDPLEFIVKYSGEPINNFIFNTRAQDSGVFVSGDLEFTKGLEHKFTVDTCVSGVNGSGTICHPFAINKYPNNTGMIGPFSRGTFSFTIPENYSGINVIEYICPSGMASESGHHINERGDIRIYDPFNFTIVSVRPEFTLAAGTHDYIDSKYWKDDEEVPCKYGGINEIKAYSNKEANCVSLSHMKYVASGLHGYQQYFPSLPELVDEFSFQDQVPKLFAGDGTTLDFVTTCSLVPIGRKKYQTLIGRKPKTDPMSRYDSPGDIDYSTLSVRWPAEKAFISMYSGIIAIPNLTCNYTPESLEDLKEIKIVDDSYTVLCKVYEEKFRNISLVDIRTNFYAVRPSRFKNEYGELRMEYVKALQSAFGGNYASQSIAGQLSSRMYLNENLDPIFGANVRDRALAGLTTYDGYYTNLIVENREWDYNAGHAFLKTNFKTASQGRGAFQIIDIDEIGRNDAEFGTIGWFFGSDVTVSGRTEATGGFSWFDAPTFRCPGFATNDPGVPSAGFISCVGQLEELYPECSAEGATMEFDSRTITFLPNSFKAGESINNIEVGMLVRGPYIPDGAYVVSTNGGLSQIPGVSDGCGPHLMINYYMRDVQKIYPANAIYNDRRYYKYKFSKPRTFDPGITDLDIQYPLRCNKAVLYAYGFKTNNGQLITQFLSFEYYEAWTQSFSSVQRVVYPRWKIEPFWPNTPLTATGWTPSAWNMLYRPVSLSAVEAKRSQGCHEVTYNEHGDIWYSVSDRDCKGIYPYYDFNTIDCPGVECASFAFGDPCGACQSAVYTPSTARGTAGPCLAEDILDYEGNSFYNGFTLVNSTHGFGSLYAGARKRALEPTDSVEGVNNFGHEANYPNGIADDPHIRGGSAGGAMMNSTDDAGNPVVTFESRSRPGPDNDKGNLPQAYYDTLQDDADGNIIYAPMPGAISPITDIIVNNQMTRMPKSVGGFNADFSQFSSPHPDASKINAPTSNDPFYVYTSDGFVSFVVLLAGEVGLIEHQYLYPPKNAVYLGNGCDDMSLAYNGSFSLEPTAPIGFGDYATEAEIEILYEPLTGQKLKNAKVCASEIVPLTLGSIVATTTLNNLHINVGAGHTPVAGGYNSWPDTWTPKDLNSEINYTDIAGNLNPASIDASGTVFVNSVALFHQENSSSYAPLVGLTGLIGAVSKSFEDSDTNGFVLKEKKIYHVNHSIGTWAEGGPYNSCGGGSDWYCYDAPEKVLSDGECISNFPGPKSFDRYLLDDPWADYLSIWDSRRCCHGNPGCSCPDGAYDSFGWPREWQGANAGAASVGLGLGHQSSAESYAVALKYGVSPKFKFSWGATLNSEAIDGRPDFISSDPACLYPYPQPVMNFPYTENFGFGNYIADNDKFGGVGPPPGISRGIKNGGAYTVDNNQFLNGVDLQAIDCCYLPSNTKCPVWYFGFNNSFFDAGSVFGAYGFHGWTNPGGGQGYKMSGTINGQAFSVEPIDINGNGFSDSGFTGEIQFYVSKKDDGNHSVFVRGYFEVFYIVPHLHNDGDIICFDGPSYPAGSTNQSIGDVGCYTVVSASPNPCQPDYQNPNYNDVVFAEGVGFNAAKGTVCEGNWSDWEEITCQNASNSVSLSFPGSMASFGISLRGDCFMSFLSETDDGGQCPVFNTNCLMGPKKVYP